MSLGHESPQTAPIQSKSFRVIQKITDDGKLKSVKFIQKKIFKNVVVSFVVLSSLKSDGNK